MKPAPDERVSVPSFWGLSRWAVTNVPPEAEQVLTAWCGPKYKRPVIELYYVFEPIDGLDVWRGDVGARTVIINSPFTGFPPPTKTAEELYSCLEAQVRHTVARALHSAAERCSFRDIVEFPLRREVHDIVQAAVISPVRRWPDDHGDRLMREMHLKRAAGMRATEATSR